MVFMILVQFSDWTPSVYLMSHELRKERENIFIHTKKTTTKNLACICKESVLIQTTYQISADPLLEPLLDWVKGVDRHGVDHGHLLVVVLVNYDHVEVLQVELHALKMDQLHLV